MARESVTRCDRCDRKTIVAATGEVEVGGNYDIVPVQIDLKQPKQEKHPDQSQIKFRYEVDLCEHCRLVLALAIESCISEVRYLERLTKPAPASQPQRKRKPSPVPVVSASENKDVSANG